MLWDVLRFFLWLALLIAVAVFGFWLVNCACYEGKGFSWRLSAIEEPCSDKLTYLGRDGNTRRYESDDCK